MLERYSEQVRDSGYDEELAVECVQHMLDFIDSPNAVEYVSLVAIAGFRGGWLLKTPYVLRRVRLS
jgi:hypothetical protein